MENDKQNFNQYFLPATMLLELSLGCLNFFQVFEIIHNFHPNELRTFYSNLSICIYLPIYFLDTGNKKNVTLVNLFSEQF